MKKKLALIMAALFASGMLVACGPGDDGTADGDVGGGGAGVVGEPAGDPMGDPMMTDPAAAPADEQVDLELEEMEPVTEDAAAADTEADLDQTAEETPADTAADQTGEEQPEAVVEAETEDAAEAQDAGDQADAAGDAAQDAEQDAQGETEVAGGGAGAEAVQFNVTETEEGVMFEGGDQTGDTANPDLNLAVGERYEFNTEGTELTFYNDNDEAVLSTSGSDSELADDQEVNVEEGAGSLSFTLTEELANELSRYETGDGQGGNVNAQ